MAKERTDDVKAFKNRMHLDLETDDVEAEVRRLFKRQVDAGNPAISGRYACCESRCTIPSSIERILHKICDYFILLCIANKNRNVLSRCDGISHNAPQIANTLGSSRTLRHCTNTRTYSLLGCWNGARRYVSHRGSSMSRAASAGRVVNECDE